MDSKTPFLTFYLRSLAERTRLEKKNTKFGFDWVIYNLAIAQDLIPHRLPFFRTGATELSKPKTEAEFGIDASFLSRDRKTLTIFVLKDEVLTNATWTANDFDGDLRRAAAPDLTAPEFNDLKEVRVVLAYNKDEDQTGIRLYENLVRSFPSVLRDDVRLAFERWNLTVLTEKVKENLLNPSLLPQPFFSLFNYICSQFADFKHGSDEWDKQLVPNWRRFLRDLLKDQADERTVRLIPVALVILRQYGDSNRTAETGWLDLAEWAMLAAWQVQQTTTNKFVKAAIYEMWVKFYLAEVERYYRAHAAELAAEHSLELGGVGNYLDPVMAAFLAFWHIGRLGLLALSFSELLPRSNEEQRQLRAKAVNEVADWLIGLVNANPAALRPLVDLHHIELYLLWKTLRQANRLVDISRWLHNLHDYLMMRRVGTIPIPFIEASNSIELVLEHVATAKRPAEFCDQSSVLLLCLIELCFSLEPPARDELVAKYYDQLVLGRSDHGEKLGKCEPIDLMAWQPPGDWTSKVLLQSLCGEGECQTIETFEGAFKLGAAALADKLKAFIDQSRSATKTTFPDDLPVGAIILGCIKHGSPLPAEIWRLSVFGLISRPSTTPSQEQPRD